MNKHEEFENKRRGELKRAKRLWAKIEKKNNPKHKSSKNKTGTPFGLYDKQWQDLRRQVFNAYGKRCMCCGDAGELHVDHIKPKSKYPKLAYEFSNLQVLCKECNKRKSNVNCNDYRQKFEQEEYDMKILASLN